MSTSSEEIRKGFGNPPEEYRPRTRWWWPGNAVTKEEIAWELQQMHEKGMGGVEICSVWNMYEKGNIPYLSEEWLDIVKYTIQTAKELKMSVALTFGPGWTFGGFWVKPDDRSKSLVPAWVEVDGPKAFKQAVPGSDWVPTLIGLPFTETLPSEIPSIDWMKQKLVALIAGKIIGEKLEEKSLTDLTSKVKENHLDWEVPDGRWRIMAFWQRFTGQQNQAQNYKPENWSLDHFDKAAVERYCNYLGGKFYEAFGEEFGKTVDSFFCDSFEVMVLPNGTYWSDKLLDEFRKFKGYNLTRYLPALWWNIGDLTPRIRYDFNEFLDYITIEWFFKPYNGWCEKNNVQARIQPYFYVEELVKGAGMTHRPECEITHAYFDVVINPRKAVSSGAHLYGRNIVSAEAYTFLHMERYRETLEELKIATDGFVRDGVNQIYNHGYPYSPERDVAPSRQVPWANLINHQNIWWKYYPHLTSYISRVCYMLQQGEFVADIAIYTPQATAWTKRTSGHAPPEMPFSFPILNYGDLGRKLVANGYDFDVINDDVIQDRAKVQDGKIKVRHNEYKILILPAIEAIPLETMKFIREYVQAGGILIALDTLPKSSVGTENQEKSDQAIQQMVQELWGTIRPGMFMFGISSHSFGKGSTYFFPGVITREFFSQSGAFFKVLRNHLTPDFDLEEMKEEGFPFLDGRKESEGLTFVHRRIGDTDVYFVTNMQDKPSDIPITFRVKGKLPEEWNPYTGQTSMIYYYNVTNEGIRIPLRFKAYESTFILFVPGNDQLHVTATNLTRVEDLTGNQLRGLTDENGLITVTLKKNRTSKTVTKQVQELAAPYAVSGTWKLTLEGKDFPKIKKTLINLASWTEDPKIKHFSGTGRHEIDFDISNDYIQKDIKLTLDLGKVGNVAEVELNGVKVGTAWMRPYRLDITKAVKQGRNHLVVLVTNTLINRVSGFKEPPPVPKELVPKYGSIPTDYVDGAEQLERSEIGFKPLPPSGLMGPVRIVAEKKVTITFAL